MIYVGTCGFSYAAWKGPFYPATIRAGEMLPYYAAAFAAVEIDASFYGVPAPATVERMVRATPKQFRFSFKIPRTLTHECNAAAAVHEDAALFVQSVEAAIAAGKFACGLLQFPNGFKHESANERYLRRLRDALEPLPLCAEFRNREWQSNRTLELLADIGVAWCNVDMPAYDVLLHPSADVTSGLGYVRFHGRNAQRWWTGNNTTRYEYAYSEEELQPWADRVAEIDAAAESTYVFFNNHARANAPRDARMFAELLAGRYGGAAPDVLAPTAPPAPQQAPLFE